MPCSTTALVTSTSPRPSSRALVTASASIERASRAWASHTSGYGPAGIISTCTRWTPWVVRRTSETANRIAASQPVAAMGTTIGPSCGLGCDTGFLLR